MARTKRTVIMDFQQSMTGVVKKNAPMNVQRNTRLPVCQIMSLARSCSYAEVRQLHEFFGLTMAKLADYRPIVGDKVQFSDGQEYYTGTVTRINRKTVSVVLDGSKNLMRVAYADLQKPSTYMTSSFSAKQAV